MSGNLSDWAEKINRYKNKTAREKEDEIIEYMNQQQKKLICKRKGCLSNKKRKEFKEKSKNIPLWGYL